MSLHRAQRVFPVYLLLSIALCPSMTRRVSARTSIHPTSRPRQPEYCWARVATSTISGISTPRTAKIRKAEDPITRITIRGHCTSLLKSWSHRLLPWSSGWSSRAKTWTPSFSSRWSTYPFISTELTGLHRTSTCHILSSLVSNVTSHLRCPLPCFVLSRVES